MTLIQRIQNRLDFLSLTIKELAGSQEAFDCGKRSAISQEIKFLEELIQTLTRSMMGM